MLGIQSNDICYSALGGAERLFSTDGEVRQVLEPELARKAFDFNIVKRENFDAHGRLIPGQWHLEKDSDGSIIPSMSVGDRFEPIQHHMVFEYIVDKVLPNIRSSRLIVAGTIHGGGVGIVIVQLGALFSLVGDESPQAMTLVFNNPSNGMGRLTLGMTVMRWYCSNQIVAAMHSAESEGLNIMHTKSGKEITAFALQTISAEIKRGLVMKDRIVRLSKASVNEAVVKFCLDRVYPLGGLEKGSRTYKNVERLRERVLNEFEGGATAQTIKHDSAWKLFNSFTYSIFNPERMRRNMDATEIQYNGIFGNRAVGVRRILSAVEDALS